MAENSSDELGSGHSDGIVSRPLSVFLELPLEYRWEFTRRHPYYLLFWEDARKHCETPSDEPATRIFGEAAVVMLQFIGVADKPVAPGTEFRDLGQSGLMSVWKAGAITPLTYRGLVGMMLRELPKESRAAIGEFLVRSSTLDDGDMSGMHRVLSEFIGFQDSSLEKMPVAPILGINVQAPLRAIVESVEQQVCAWKDVRGIKEHRRRDDKLPEYLKVWDLREGWVGDHYDVRQEKTLREIARELSENLDTVANRYRSAFRYLTGHDYKPELWARVFGLLKASFLADPRARPRRTTHRPWKSRTKRDVPESVVAPARPDRQHGGTFIENLAVVQDMHAASELAMDIQSLLERGYDNARIAEELELDRACANDLIAYLRQRREEGI